MGRGRREVKSKVAASGGQRRRVVCDVHGQRSTTLSVGVVPSRPRAPSPMQPSRASASFDNLRLWNLTADEKSHAPFQIIPGHHGEVISQVCMSGNPPTHTSPAYVAPVPFFTHVLSSGRRTVSLHGICVGESRLGRDDSTSRLLL